MVERSRCDSSGCANRGTTLTAFLLDTNVLIDAERSNLDLDHIITDHDEVAVAAITIAELAAGVALAVGKRRRAREAFLHEIVEVLPIIDYTVDVARAHAELLVAVKTAGRPRGAHDLIIASTAKATVMKSRYFNLWHDSITFMSSQSII